MAVAPTSAVVAHLRDMSASRATVLADRYALRGEIGRGGCAMVYEAHDLRLGRLVALKMVKNGARDTQASARLAREARAGAAIAGIPGLLLYLGVWCSVILCFWRGYSIANPPHYRGLCLAAFLASLVFMVSSLTEATFADEEVRQLAMFVWAAGLSVWYKGSTPAVQD